jgi:hypothetical protein
MTRISETSAGENRFPIAVAKAAQPIILGVCMMNVCSEEKQGKQEIHKNHSLKKKNRLMNNND